MRTAITSPDRDLTPLMWQALAKASTAEGLGSWDFASGILSALKQTKLVELRSIGHTSRYFTTEFGTRRLAGRSAR